MADTPRLRALQSLSDALPVANQQVAQQQSAGRDLQLQAAVAGAPAQSEGAGMASQIGTAQTQQAGQQKVAQAQQEVGAQEQVAKLGQHAEQSAATNTLEGMKSSARNEEMTNVQRFANLNASVKQELYDKQMQFQQDETGRTLLNVRQLADYARLNAQSDNDMANHQQRVEQVSKREMQIMEQSYKTVIQDLDQKYRVAEKNQDQQAKIDIMNKKLSAETTMKQKANEVANRRGMWTAAGGVVGAIVGAYAGNPMAGAAIGAGAGGIGADASQS